MSETLIKQNGKIIILTKKKSFLNFFLLMYLDMIQIKGKAHLNWKMELLTNNMNIYIYIILYIIRLMFFVLVLVPLV